MSLNKRLALGRGLGAVLDEVEEAYARDLRSNMELVIEIDLNKIKANPFQPRKNFDDKSLIELSNSIAKHGLLQPVIVISDEQNYILIAGERRLRATKLLGKKTIKAVVANITYKSIRELALIENIQREDLNPIELAISYDELIKEYEITHDELAEIVHKSRVSITNTIRLLQLNEYTKEKLIENKITHGHAKVLIGLSQDNERKVVDSIINQKLSVRETEKIVKSLKNGQKDLKIKPKTTVFNFESASEVFNKYNIKTKTSGKNITLSFYSQEELDKFISVIKTI